jgi:hypothetical protein
MLARTGGMVKVREMRFTKAQSVENIVWQMKLADIPRANNRTLIDLLYNGSPPYTERQVLQNSIQVNYNDLSGTKITQDAQGQYSQAVFSPAQYFSVRADRGPKHMRDEWSETITKGLRRAMKRGLKANSYRENLRNVFAQLVLHGSAAMLWQDSEKWCPQMQAIADVQVPSGTFLTMDNLSYFAVYRRYTATRLYEMTHGPVVDPGWNIDVANSCIKWALEQYGQTMTTDYIYNPERVQEDFKSDGGLYNSDAVPTVNCWDFYCLEDEGDESGWKRRIVLDAPSIGSDTKPDQKITADVKNILNDRGQFLYTSGDRNYASKLSEIVHFQFADGSVVAPFRYHSVRSLGWLLYSVCHIQNRLRCALTEAAFEACLQYFRVSSSDEMQRAIKVNLINKGVIPDGVNFVGAQERWKVDANLLESVMNLNSRIIADNSTAYTKNFGYGESQSVDKTATQISAEVGAASQLLGSMLEQFYGYQEFQDQEIARRFCIPNSSDPDVREFRLYCLSHGVPEELLNSDAWDINHERIMGSGNSQLAMQQAQAIMSQYPLLDPSGQRIALRKFMFAHTSDAETTELLVPSQPKTTTDSTHDAQLAAASLLLSVPMGLKEGVSHSEYAASLIGIMGIEIQKITKSGGVGTPDQIMGLQNLAGQTIDGQPMMNPDGSPGNGASFHIAVLAQDPNSNELVKKLGDELGKSLNEVRAFAQRLQEQQGQQQEGDGVPADQKAKVAVEMMKGEAKLKLMAASHEQRSKQKAAIHRQQMEEKQAKSQLDNANTIRRTQVEESATDLKTAAEIKRNRAASAEE